MCLIIVKKKGTSVTPELYKSITRSYNLRNRDGFGFALKRGKKVYISKGYFDLKTFIKKLKSFHPKKDDELIVHLRKVSAGKRDISNCHPYVCSEVDEEILLEEGFVNLPVMAHNGTFHYYKKHNSDFSDTFHFIKEFAGLDKMPYILSSLAKRDIKLAKKLLPIDNSKIAFLLPGNFPLLTFGTFTYDNGYYYSNTSYLGDNCPTHGKPKRNMTRNVTNGYYNMFEEEVESRKVTDEEEEYMHRFGFI